MALASHLFNSSVGGTKHLVRSIVGLESFELYFYLDCVSSDKQFYLQQLGAAFSEEFGQLHGLFNSMQQHAFCEPRMVTFPHGCLFCLWLEVSLICQHKSLGMALLPGNVVPHLPLIMLLTVVLVVW